MNLHSVTNVNDWLLREKKINSVSKFVQQKLPNMNEMNYDFQTKNHAVEQQCSIFSLQTKEIG